jgi:hypothetical protein
LPRNVGWNKTGGERRRDEGTLPQINYEEAEQKGQVNEPLHHHYNDGKSHPDCERCKRDRRLFANDLPARTRKQIDKFVAGRARRNIERRARKVTLTYEPVHGNLILVVDPEEIPRLRRLGRGHPETCVAEAAFVRDYLKPQGFRTVNPEDIGALTSGLLVQNDKGDIFWDQSYQVLSFLEELIAGRAVEWQKG